MERMQFNIDQMQNIAKLKIALTYYFFLITISYVRGEDNKDTVLQCGIKLLLTDPIQNLGD